MTLAVAIGGLVLAGVVGLVCYAAGFLDGWAARLGGIDARPTRDDVHDVVAALRRQGWM